MEYTLFRQRRIVIIAFIVTCCYLYSLRQNNNTPHEGNSTIINRTVVALNSVVKVPTCVNERGDHCVKPYFVPERVDCLQYESPSIDSSGAWYLPQNFMYKFDQKFANAILDRVVEGGSVLELGAGLGCYTYYFRDSGKVLSIDGYEGAANVEEMSEGFIKQADLTKIQVFGSAQQQLYDWVVCMEVAEHIPPEHEHTFLINLVSHANKGILLSWGTLKQLGHGHVNLKSNAYVIGMMHNFGFEYDENASLYLRGEAEFSWFKGSTMVFRKGDMKQVK
jgi:2-polyprenyl-3-methyl-5-hydroxy-6-metoxy-1,4-benzoquinol methylase